MFPIAIALQTFAFLTASAAVALLAVLSVRSTDRLIVRLLQIEGFLFLTASVNAVQFLAAALGGGLGARGQLLALCIVFTAIIGASRAILLLSLEATGFDPWTTAIAKSVFSAAAVGTVWFGVFRMAFSGGGFRYGPGFTVSGMFGAFMILVSLLVVALRLERMRKGPRRIARVCIALFSSLALLAGANEFYDFGSYFGFPHVPFSPILLSVANVLVIVLAVRRLLGMSVAAAGKPFVESGTNADLPGPLPAEAFDAEAAVTEIVATPEAVADRFALSVREREILPMLFEGADYVEIGERLFISPHTVKNHVQNIYRKTGAQNRFDLIKLAHR